jgi:hypothetical protein
LECGIGAFGDRTGVALGEEANRVGLRHRRPARVFAGKPAGSSRTSYSWPDRSRGLVY